METQLPIQPALASIQSRLGLHHQILPKQPESRRILIKILGQPKNHPIPLHWGYEPIMDVGKNVTKLR